MARTCPLEKDINYRLGQSRYQWQSGFDKCKSVKDLQDKFNHDHYMRRMGDLCMRNPKVPWTDESDTRTPKHDYRLFIALKSEENGSALALDMLEKYPEEEMRNMVNAIGRSGDVDLFQTSVFEIALQKKNSEVMDLILKEENGFDVNQRIEQKPYDNGRIPLYTLIKSDEDLSERDFSRNVLKQLLKHDDIKVGKYIKNHSSELLHKKPVFDVLPSLGWESLFQKEMCDWLGDNPGPSEKRNDFTWYIPGGLRFNNFGQAHANCEHITEEDALEHGKAIVASQGKGKVDGSRQNAALRHGQNIGAWAEQPHIVASPRKRDIDGSSAEKKQVVVSQNPASTSNGKKPSGLISCFIVCMFMMLFQ